MVLGVASSDGQRRFQHQPRIPSTPFMGVRIVSDGGKEARLGAVCLFGAVARFGTAA